MANRDQQNKQARTNKPKVSTKEKQARKAAKVAAKRDKVFLAPK